MSISVCIATYNGEKYIQEQLESILIQLHEEDEIILSDDSSTDQTVAIVKALKDIRIKIFEHQTFASHVYNFEHALKQAKGEYLFLSDQDDIWLSHKRETMLKHLKNHDLVISDATVVDEDKNLLHDSFFAFNHSKKGLLKNIYKNSYLGCCMAFNTEILHKALPFPKNINMHDWWIGLIAERYASIYFCEESLLLYRRHHQALTPISRKSKNSFFSKIGFRIAILQGLFLRSIALKQKYDL